MVSDMPRPLVDRVVKFRVWAKLDALASQCADWDSARLEIEAQMFEAFFN
jgi:hypothetical protein